MSLKLLNLSLFFSLFLIPLNVLGQETTSACDRSDFMHKAFKEQFPSYDSSWSCEEAYSVLKEVTGWVVTGKSAQIESLKEDDFAGLSEMTFLRIEYTDITSLPEEIFQGLYSLEFIDLIYNQIEDLPEGIFERLYNLKSLSLGFNNIETLPEDIFQGLDRLQFFDLSYNKIEELPVVIFQGLSQVHMIDLRNNNIEMLPVEILQGLPQLEHLFLDKSVQNIDEIQNFLGEDVYVTLF